MANTTDRITVNAGGRLFETTRSTLLSSGSKFFQALLGTTGSTLAGNSIARSCIFLDRDSDLFGDVLFCMRSHRLPARTRNDLGRLHDLLLEADFYAYDALQECCVQCLQALKESEPSAQSHLVKVESGQPVVIAIPNGQYLYVVSANGTKKSSNFHPLLLLPPDDGIYHPPPHGMISNSESLSLKVRIQDAQFTLCTHREDSENEKQPSYPNSRDSFHNNNSSNLPMCLSAPETGSVELVTEGTGDFEVLYWIGHQSALPGRPTVSNTGKTCFSKRVE